jgi:hypothetical protein
MRTNHNPSVVRVVYSVAILWIVLPLLNWSCRAHTEGNEADKAYLLTRLPWRYNKYVVDGQQIKPPTDYLTFRTDGSSLLSDGSNTVEGSRWELMDGASRLRFNRGTKSETSVEILELSSGRLRFRGVATDLSGRETQFEASLAH